MLILLEEIRQSKGTLFILGDFFDFWFDKNDHVPPVLEPVIKSLKAIVDAGIEIHYLGGNHDYWIEGYLTHKLGVRFYPDALYFSWQNKRIYCQHGDHIVYTIEQYPWIRKVLRAPLAISMLKVLPIHWTYKLGEKVSHYNRSVPEPTRISELLVNKMHEYLREKWDEGYDISLSGHVHYPYLEISEDQKVMAVIGDWIDNRSYGYMDERGFRLING